jgi:hypothetical protein
MKISKLFSLYPADIATLEVQRIKTISQIFETHLSGRIDKSISPELMTSLTLYPVLQHMLKVFMRALLHQLFPNKYSCPRSNLAILANLDINLSRRDQLKICELLDTSVGVAPAYHTRIQDNIAIRPSQRDFTNAYSILQLPTLTSKINRTIWTNNKAFKSRMRPDPNCERCNKAERKPTEHLICECE